MQISSLIVGCLATVIAVSASPLIPRQSANASSTQTVLLGNPSAQPNPAANPNLVAALLTADSTATRFQRLQDAITSGAASQRFDYNPVANPKVFGGQGGEAVVSNRSVFPMVTTLGISGVVSYFAPCGLNTPHTHPRASEIFTVSTNSTIQVGFVLENGMPQEFNTTLTQYQGTVFPIGSMHWQQNTGCEPAVAIGAFSSEDPGVSSVIQNLFVSTDSEVVLAAMGNPKQITSQNYNELKGYMAPSFARGVKACYDKCGMQY